MFLTYWCELIKRPNWAVLEIGGDSVSTNCVLVTGCWCYLPPIWILSKLWYFAEFSITFYKLWWWSLGIWWLSEDHVVWYLQELCENHFISVFFKVWSESSGVFVRNVNARTLLQICPSKSLWSILIQLVTNGDLSPEVNEWLEHIKDKVTEIEVTAKIISLLLAWIGRKKWNYS